MGDTGFDSHRSADTADDRQSEQKQSRERSQIEFPYTDISQAEELARKLFEGGGAAEPAQLATWMDKSAAGGTFRSRLSAARMFGFIEIDRNSVRITDKGRDALDPDKARAVRSEAFLRVPLFAAMYEKNRGYELPPAAAIERQMMELGVPKKQKERARQVFQKSATVAQFIDPGSGRFIKPAVGPGAKKADSSNADPETSKVGIGGGGGGDDGKSGHHPFIEGLLNELPKGDNYPDWKIEDQAEWLRTAAGIFKLLSKQPGRIKVEFERPTASSETEETSFGDA